MSNSGSTSNPILANRKNPDVPMEATPTPTPTGTPSQPSPTGTACGLSEGGFESGTLDPYISVVATCVPGGCGWTVSTTSPHSGSYSAFAPDVSDISDQMLVRSAPIPVFYYGGLTFWHSYNFESNGTNFYDGGVIEASTDSGATWADMGPNIVAGGYGGTISTCCSNPLQGRMAWVGNSGGYVQTSISLVPYGMQSLLIRFREGTDSSVSSAGWYIDEIYSFVSCVTYTPVVTGTPTYTSTPIPTDTPTETETPTATDTGQPTKPTDTETPVATPTTSSCTLEFADVPPDSTFYPFIHCLACRGIINGYPCGGPGEPCNGNSDPYFRPGNPVTRGQLAKIVSKSAGFTDPPVGQTFEDVPVGSTPYTYTQRLASRSVMSGYPCGGPGEPCIAPGNRPYFRPSSGATRGQLTKIVANAAGFTDPPPGTYTFTDVPVGSTFHQYVEALLLNRPGVMGGYPCGAPLEPCDSENRPYFRPSNGLTRGQTSKIDSNTFFPGCSIFNKSTKPVDPGQTQ